MKVRAKKEAAMLAEINKVINVLKESPLKIGAKTGTSGKIFGSVTPLQISRAVRDQKVTRSIANASPLLMKLKNSGTYKANIDFGNGNSTEVEFEVVGE
jgi:large subunit ribosomal protein L9